MEPEPSSAGAQGLTANRLGIDGGSVLVLAPHLDDAWLSTAAVLFSARCEVWTVFAGAPVPKQCTEWDARLGFTDSGATMRARIAEDERAFRGTGHRVVRLPYLDAAYTTPQRRREDLADLRDRLSDWLDLHPRGHLIVPICAGAPVKAAPWAALLRRRRRPPSPSAGSGASAVASRPAGSARYRRGVDPRRLALHTARSIMHADYQRRRRAAQRSGMAINPDHEAVRETALESCRDESAERIIFSEDLPYLWSCSGQVQVDRLEQRMGVTLARYDVDVDRGAKHDRLRHYESQLVVLDPLQRRLSTSVGLPFSESYWRVTSRRDSRRP